MALSRHLKPRHARMHNLDQNKATPFRLKRVLLKIKGHQRLHALRELLFGSAEFIAHWALRLLPIDVCSNIGYVLGRIIGPMHRKPTQQLRENITRLRPDMSSKKQIDAMVKRSWGNYGRVMAEFSVLRRIWRSNRTRVEGLENFTTAKATGRPIICLFLHLGNWEVVGPKLNDVFGGNWLQIYQKIDDRMKLRIAENVRRPYAYALITAGPFIGKKIYNKLSEGYNLNLAVDEWVNDELNTPSFGRPRRQVGNLTLAVRLAKLTNAILCPAYVTRTKGARFLLHIKPPVILDFTHFDRQALQETVNQLDQLIDPIIREHIDQWFYGSALKNTDKEII